jgi:hypothetical protein
MPAVAHSAVFSGLPSTVVDTEVIDGLKSQTLKPDGVPVKSNL